MIDYKVVYKTTYRAFYFDKPLTIIAVTTGNPINQNLVGSYMVMMHYITKCIFDRDQGTKIEYFMIKQCAMSVFLYNVITALQLNI